MDKMISGEFNIDTACVEVKYADGSVILQTVSVTGQQGHNTRPVKDIIGGQRLSYFPASFWEALYNGSTFSVEKESII